MELPPEVLADMSKNGIFNNWTFEPIVMKGKEPDPMEELMKEKMKMDLLLQKQKLAALEAQQTKDFLDKQFNDEESPW